MIVTTTSPSRGRQRGAALLLMMLAVIVAGSALLVSRLSTTAIRAQRLTSTHDTLGVARDALLGYAAIRPDLAFGQPVALPCPDLDDSLGLDEGVAHTASCGAAGETVMGRVPWRTLGIAPPRDSGSACLWYVVSGSWKDAGGNTAGLVNPDSNGQLQLWGIDAGTVIAGAAPADRPVAMVIAPMEALPGQNRAAPSGRQCSANFSAANFLDDDASSGISNSALSGAVDTLDILAMATALGESHNDRIAIITRSDLERATIARADFDTRMRSLGVAVTECVADYARHNAGGVDDRRLPWPAPLQLADYRPDAAYDDADAGTLSGRLSDVVDDSSTLTGNSIADVLGGCDPATVVQWSPAMYELWSHWKDHFFYVVAESYAPDAVVPSACTNCLTVNGSGQYAALVLFGNSRLGALGQLRNAPPTDIDTKRDAVNYLEDANAGAFPYAGGGLDLVSTAETTTFNDLLFCIDETLVVIEC